MEDDPAHGEEKPAQAPNSELETRKISGFTRLADRFPIEGKAIGLHSTGTVFLVATLSHL